MSNLNKLYTQAAQAIDTSDLLQHLAWTNVVEPAFKDYRDRLTTEMVDRILNKTVNPNALTVEQIAGRIAGIDWVFNLIKRIAREGKQAQGVLRDLNINLE